MTVSDGRTPHGPAAMAVPVAPAPGAAWTALRRAAERAPAYRDLLARAGVDPAAAGDWGAVPVVSRRDVFVAADGWIARESLTAAAEIVCSSGQSGPPFALGLSGRGADAAMRARVDGLLSALGARPDSPSLLVNALPMGIAVPSDLATCATPSVHPEMALHVLTEVAPAFDRVLLVAEPLFLAELARRWRAAGRVHPETWMVTGGEPVAEAWRGYLCGILGLDRHRVMISMGAAELGLHLLHEVPELAAARAVAAADPVAAADGTWGALCGGAYAPALLTFDPERLHVETPEGPDGPRLVMTVLDDVPLPLVRYDLGDAALLLDDDAVGVLEERCGLPLPRPVVALAGRAARVRSAAGRPVRPEAVRELLFADPALADGLTGRFRLRAPDGGAVLECHLEARDRGAPDVSAEAALRKLEDALRRLGGVPTRVVRHASGAYPFHAEGDWTHKPRYTDPAGGGA
ncbi:MAG: hypothetical protein IT200_16980 [Thermoleophilia bacterium]|nr:hypothetical protein [Thermoleophilia bacterium]